MRHRPHIVLGIGASVVLATALGAHRPAVAAGPGHAANQPASLAAPAHADVPSPDAPHVGQVRGALSGPAAVRAAGKAADAFRVQHARLVAQLQQRGGHGQVKPGPASGPADASHAWYGPEPPDGGADGTQATQSVIATMQLSTSGDFVYAPTLKPPSSSCIENVTAYQANQAPQLWAWDWCGTQGPAKTLNIDDSFLKTYTQKVNGRDAYSIQEVQTDAGANSWTTYLYNVTTKSWESFYTSKGTDNSKLGHGWDLFEIYANPSPNYCDNIPSGGAFESSSIMDRSGGESGKWSPLTADSAPIEKLGEFRCDSLQFDMVHPNDDFVVHK
jgi:hypothetical protein